MNKVALIILDGVGYSKNKKGNAVAMAKMPNYKKIIKRNATLIKASGQAVGYSIDTISGNSEVGHNTMGAGKIYKQGLNLVNIQFKGDRIFETQTWKNFIENGKKNAIHFIGLLSDSTEHGNISHLKKLITRCQKEKVKNVYVHALLDGRDVAPQSGIKYIKDITTFLSKTNKKYKLIDFGGRNKIVMDRYNANPELVIKGYDLYVNKVGQTCNNPETTLREIYLNNPQITDQEIDPYIIDKKISINNGDSVMLYNFRGDRSIEFSQMFDEGKFLTKQQYKKINKCFYIGMMQYDDDLKIPQKYLVNPPLIKGTLTEYLIKNKVKQLAISETQKFGHITYCFNGNRKEKFSEIFEKYKEIKSDKNITFDTKPNMKAVEITDVVCKEFANPKYNFYKVNFPNGDMVGHTGNLEATIQGLETVDKCLGKIISSAKDNNIILIIVADHGNCEKMLNNDGSINTSHTNNPVFFSLINNKRTKYKIKKGNFGLSNIANSICKALDIQESKQFDEGIIK